MLTRRHLLSGIALGGLMAPLSLRSAVALTAEPMPKPLVDLAALRCTAKVDAISLKDAVPTTADHGDLLARNARGAQPQDRVRCRSGDSAGSGGLPALRLSADGHGASQLLIFACHRVYP